MSKLRSSALFIFSLLCIVFPQSDQFTINNNLESNQAIDLDNDINSIRVYADGTSAPAAVASDCKGSLGSYLCTSLKTGCYCIVTKQMTWFKAYQYCQNNGKSLLSIDTATKQLDLQTNLPTIMGTNPTFNIVKSIGLWTSGTYLESLNVFLWTAPSFQLFSFANWMYGEPNQSTLACVRIIPSLASVWADVDCKQWLPFICE